ncbi:MAG TPA: glycosyltransferase family 4 protein, partial [Terriglobales bacterium]|nr:glycosyltransferase family 4 protein [Terriglobales bacterium]
WAVDAGVLRSRLIYRYLRWKEIQQYDSADVIALQSRGDLKYFEQNFGQRRYRLEVFYNWIALPGHRLPKTQYRDKLGLQGKVVFFYGGNFGIAQDMENIVRLASSLSGHPEIHFLLVGEGSETQRLQRMIAERHLTNIRILSPIAQQEYLGMVSEFDIGLVTLDRRLTTQNIPGKILGYLYWGLPILASLNPGNDLFDLLGKNQAGVCLLNGEDEKLKHAALRLAADANLRTQMGSKGRALLKETFSVHSAARRVLQCFPQPNVPGERLEQVQVPVAHASD